MWQRQCVRDLHPECHSNDAVCNKHMEGCEKEIDQVGQALLLLRPVAFSVIFIKYDSML